MGKTKIIPQKKIERVLHYRRKGKTYREIKQRLPTLSLYMIQKIIKTAERIEKEEVEDLDIDLEKEEGEEKEFEL